MESGEEDTGKNGAETETEIGPRTMKSLFDNKGSAVKTIRRTARYLDLRNGVRYDTEEQKRGSAIINDSVSTLDMDRSIGENIPDQSGKTYLIINPRVRRTTTNTAAGSQVGRTKKQLLLEEPWRT